MSDIKFNAKKRFDDSIFNQIIAKNPDAYSKICAAWDAIISDDLRLFGRIDGIINALEIDFDE